MHIFSIRQTKILVFLGLSMVLLGILTVAHAQTRPVLGYPVANNHALLAPHDANSPGLLIVVASRIRQDGPLLDNIHHVTNTAYRLFHEHGYTHGDIYYLATDPSLDADGDGLADVDAPLNRTNLMFAISQWALHRLQPDQVVTMYLMGYAGFDLFYLDKPAGEWVTPDEVDAWLDQLEAPFPNNEVNLIVDACYTGSFVAASATEGGAKRMVISSTSADGLAWASPEGSAFSDPFLAALGQGMSLGDALAEARSVLAQWGRPQTPWLDSDGDGIPNETEDETLAAQRMVFPGVAPPTPTPVPTLEPDSYEPDDTCAQAHPIAITGQPQDHSIHRPGDTDWVHFDVEADQTYVIEAIAAAPQGGMRISLFNSCIGDDGPFHDLLQAALSSARLVFTASSSGTYYLQTAGMDAQAYGPHMNYTLSVVMLQDRVYLPLIRQGMFLEVFGQ